METKFYFSCFLLISQLTGCTANPKINSNSLINSDLSVSLSIYGVNLIEWEDILRQQVPEYFGYVYSETCNFCELIRPRIEKFAESRPNEFFFVKYNTKIKINMNYKDCIGATSVENLSIKGTPTLFLINNGAILDCFCGTEEIIEYLNTY